MKLQFPMAALAVALLAGGAASAQGTFSPNKPKAPWQASKPTPSPGFTPAAPKTYGAPQAKIYGAPKPAKPEPFKPYEPYKPKSVFGQPKR